MVSEEGIEERRCWNCGHGKPEVRKLPEYRPKAASLFRPATEITLIACWCEKFIQGNDPKDDEMAFQYDEGGDFVAGPNFGCIHWKEKIS